MIDTTAWNERVRGHMRACLGAAVPLWITQLRERDWDYVMERARVCGQHIAEKGDVIQFKSKRKGESAEAFNRLAEGIACLAFARGGVTFLGDHWEAAFEEKR